jgi:putative SOS response-associated peptidase YedK
MCGRSSLTKVEKEIEARFKATFYSEELERYNPLPNFNVAPTHMHPVITSDDRTHIHLYRWGLIPFWAKDVNIGSKLINARAETLMDKTAFRQSLASRRCIVPLDGFYEWKTNGKQKTPYRIIAKDQDIFSVAGLWDSWQNTNGDTIHSFTIITIAPNTLMKEIHDRMPAMLLKENENVWLDNDLKATDALQLLLPYPSDQMEAYPVSDKVNSVKVNDKSLIERVIPKQIIIQTSLFD